jgi:dienelactone hydrolase
VIERPVDYTVDGKTHRGYLVWDDANATPRPLVMMVPNWLGNNEANRKQAATIAGSEYVIFLADMYGLESRPANTGEAGVAVKALYANRPLMRSRAAASLDAAVASVSERKLPVDLARRAAIGFCFGGATVLEMARAGVDLAGVVSFHGNLSLAAPAQDGTIRSRILVLHGDADPYVPPIEVQAFVDEMRGKKPDWELVSYGGAVHSFSHPNANQPGAAMYDEKVARRAFARMRDFLAESFAAKP